jgi:hypothetical protein
VVIVREVKKNERRRTFYIFIGRVFCIGKVPRWEAGVYDVSGDEGRCDRFTTHRPECTFRAKSLTQECKVLPQYGRHVPRTTRMIL